MKPPANSSVNVSQERDTNCSHYLSGYIPTYNEFRAVAMCSPKDNSIGRTERSNRGILNSASQLILGCSKRAQPVELSLVTATFYVILISHGKWEPLKYRLRHLRNFFAQRSLISRLISRPAFLDALSSYNVLF